MIKRGHKSTGKEMRASSGLEAHSNGYQDKAPGYRDKSTLDDESENDYGKNEVQHDAKLEVEEGWEEEVWFEKWRSNSGNYLVLTLPNELSERIHKALQDTEIKRNEFILQSIEQACRDRELEIIRKQGLESGDLAKLIKDPQTGRYRCFPTDFFSEEDLYGFEVIDGKYYQKRWAKTESGWLEVNSGYFEATSSQQDAPYIKMDNNCPVGSWEVYPFVFFEHDWKWGIYDNMNIILEVRGRKEGHDPLWLDIYVDGRIVSSVHSPQEAHDKIIEYLG